MNYRRSTPNIITVLFIAVMYLLFVASIEVSGHGNSATERLGYLFLATIIATYAMNMTFTAWHEASHNLISRNRHVNDLFGILGSAPLAFPGYYGRKREHIVHHRYEADPDFDPVYPRLQETFLGYLAKSVNISSRLNPLVNTRSYDIAGQKIMTLTNAEAIFDKIQMLVTGIVLILATGLFPIQSLAVFYIPRGLVFIGHAWYICFLSHKPSKFVCNDVLYHCFSDSPLWRVLTINQCLHGFHHKYPNIPWYKYKRIQSEGFVTR